ncbi:MAG: protein jag [Firmicutes bacterium]|nr:protein jag [Bacillota bacterium]
MDAVERWGASVEEAVDLALKEMKATADEVNVTVLEEPSRGFFGIGSKLAKVRIEKKQAEKAPEEEKKEAPKKPGPIGKEPVSEEEKVIERQDRPERKRSGRKQNNRKDQGGRREKRSAAPEKEYHAGPNIALDGLDKESLTVVEEHEALTFLKEVTEKMGLSLDFEVRTGENLIYIEMSGEDSRTIIGKRGQTLDAVQYLTSLVVNKENEDYIKVVLDAENYRAKRQRTLEQLANRLAGKVVKTGKYVRLEPMNPYERKVIHATLQNHPDVVTRSEGEEPYRRVIIEQNK